MVGWRGGCDGARCQQDLECRGYLQPPVPCLPANLTEGGHFHTSRIYYFGSYGGGVGRGRYRVG